MTARRFRQVDVFATVPYAGNPLAVVLDAEGLDDELMQRFARWTNLSETTFVLPPRDPAAHYRVRIFTPTAELPFAGHPTLGTAHAWLEAGGTGDDEGVVVQECTAGLMPVRRTDAGLAFAAPPITRYEPVGEATVEHIAAVLGIDRASVVDSHWVDNGPGWVAVLLAGADDVLALRPAGVDLDLGVAGPCAPGSAEAFEVRAFFPVDGTTREDPVTGSLNAALAEWLTATGRAEPPYVARKGTAMGRDGRVHVTRDDDGRFWVGGGTVTCVSGDVHLD